MNLGISVPSILSVDSQKAMSLRIINKNVNILCDEKGKELFLFPKNTLMDKICCDSWGEIMRYMKYHPYIVGLRTKKYVGYRPIKIHEFNVDHFINYYYENDGLHSMLQYNCPGDPILSVDGHYMRLFGSDICCSIEYKKVKLSSNDIVFMNNTTILSSIVLIKSRSQYNYVIFVPCD
jgi:hypothetical protein